MMAFLILAGVATAMAAPVLLSGIGADADDDVGAEEVPKLGEEETGQGDLLDAMFGDGPVDRGAGGGQDTTPGLAVGPCGGAANAPEIAAVADAQMDDPMDHVMREVGSMPLAATSTAILVPEPGGLPDLAPGDHVTVPVLAPTDPDGPDEPSDDPVDTPLLAPTPGDAPDSPRAAEGALVEAFVAGQDVLRLALPAGMSPSDFVVDVHPSADGEDGIVTVNGRVVAILEGAPEAGPEDIEIEFSEPGAA